MSLQADLVKLEGEIKTKTTEWQASSKAVQEAESATAEQVDALRTGNKELSALIDKKNTLGELIAETEAVTADVKAAQEAEEKSLREGRNIQRQGNEGAGNGKPKEEEEERWTVKATKALLKDSPTERNPHRVEKGLKALFNEGAFTAASGNVPGYYTPGSSEGYGPELRRDPALFTPDAVRPVQFWNTIPQIPTTRPTDVYMKETVNADSTSIFTGEGGRYTEDDGYDYNEASNPIKDVGSYYGVTRDILEDEPMMMAILEQRVLERMSRKLDDAFVNGASAANTFAGVTHVRLSRHLRKGCCRVAPGGDHAGNGGHQRPVGHRARQQRRPGGGGRHLRHRADLLGVHAPAGRPRQLHGLDGAPGSTAVAGCRRPGDAAPGPRGGRDTGDGPDVHAHSRPAPGGRVLDGPARDGDGKRKFAGSSRRTAHGCVRRENHHHGKAPGATVCVITGA